MGAWGGTQPARGSCAVPWVHRDTQHTQPGAAATLAPPGAVPVRDLARVAKSPSSGYPFLSLSPPGAPRWRWKAGMEMW